jgi:hypothetical protein
MQSSVGHGSEQRIDRRDAIRGGFARRGPLDLLDVFVADRDRPILVPGVGFAIAALGLHEQRPWQTDALCAKATEEASLRTVALKLLVLVGTVVSAHAQNPSVDDLNRSD